MFWPITEYVDEWRLPLAPSSGEGAPPTIVDACGAVGRDLYCRRHGEDVDLSGWEWVISLQEDGHTHIGLESRGFTFAGPHMDVPLADATVLVADAVQGELAGYMPYIQWPIEEKRLLLPVVRDGTAIWRDPRTDRSVAEIGLLAIES